MKRAFWPVLVWLIYANRHKQKDWFLWKNMHKSMSRNWENSSSMLQSLPNYFISIEIEISAIVPGDPEFNSLDGPTNFQKKNFLLLILLVKFWGHQTFLFKISNLRNHFSFSGSEGWAIKAYLLLQGLRIFTQRCQIISQSFATTWASLVCHFWTKHFSFQICLI